MSIIETAKSAREAATKTTKEVATWTVKNPGEAVSWTTGVTPYLALSRSLVFGGLVRRQVQLQISGVLRRLREIYVAERSPINPASEKGNRERTRLNEMIQETTDFLEQNTDISRQSKGRACARGRERGGPNSCFSSAGIGRPGTGPVLASGRSS